MAMTMTGEVTLAGRKAEGVGAAQRPRCAQSLHSRAASRSKRRATTASPRSSRPKIGPVAATFKGKVELSDIVPLVGYTINGEGEGGVAGFAKGGAKVSLADAEGGTLLHYDVEATCRRQDRPARLAPDRRRRQEHGRQVFRQFRRRRAAAGAGAAPATPRSCGGQRGSAAAAAAAAPRRSNPDEDVLVQEDMGMVHVSMTVNGRPASADVDPRTLLVQFLRENLRLTGTHVGCDTSQCGACVVHVDGRAIKSCTVLAASCDGAQVTTIEGLAATASCIRCSRPSRTITACNAASARRA